MSADLLREAASVLRERAEAAEPGPWVTRSDHLTRSEIGADIFATSGEPIACDGDGYQGACVSFDAAYIATVHPAVGLALADWLEFEATQIPPEANTWIDRPLSEAPAVRVAAAILGRSK